jgi:hypothetical protein
MNQGPSRVMDKLCPLTRNRTLLSKHDTSLEQEELMHKTMTVTVFAGALLHLDRVLP